VSTKLSVEQVLANLEQQMAFHQEREAHHAEQEAYHQAQEVFHREQREAHAAEHAVVRQHYEAFKATAGTAAELAARTVTAPPEPLPQEKPPPPEPPEEEALPDDPAHCAQLVARWVTGLAAGVVFGPTQAAGEVNRRFHRQLSKPADVRGASVALRRLLARGVIRRVRKGKAHHEALYSKV
jgi:hypothetical protein